MNVRDEVKEWARDVLADPATAILDTETTGLHGYACEISVMRADGGFLLDTLVNPGVPVEPGAYAVHGLGDEQLSGAPPIGDVWPRLAEIINERRIVFYNATFDAGVIHREITRLQVISPTPIRRRLQSWECAMTRYSDWFAGCYDARWLRLNGGHRAADDCRATLARLREMAA